MAEFLDEYLRAGLTQIVVIDYSHKENRPAIRTSTPMKLWWPLIADGMFGRNAVKVKFSRRPAVENSPGLLPWKSPKHNMRNSRLDVQDPTLPLLSKHSKIEQWPK